MTKGILVVQSQPGSPDEAAMAEAGAAGKMTRPSGVQLDPPPTTQWFHDLNGG